MTTVVYIDKKHRVKKTKNGWLPQWKKFIFWHTYSMCICDIDSKGFLSFNNLSHPPYFETDKHAIEFVKKTINAKTEGCHYVDFYDTYPDGLLK